MISWQLKPCLKRTNHNSPCDKAYAWNGECWCIPGEERTPTRTTKQHPAQIVTQFEFGFYPPIMFSLIVSGIGIAFLCIIGISGIIAYFVQYARMVRRQEVPAWNQAPQRMQYNLPIWSFLDSSSSWFLYSRWRIEKISSLESALVIFLILAWMMLNFHVRTQVQNQIYLKCA